MFKLSSTKAKQSLRSLSSLAKTALHDLHVEKGGKMVEFAGYALPVQFEGLGVLKEHVSQAARMHFNSSTHTAAYPCRKFGFSI